MGVRWYVAYSLSTRHVEERMRERGVHVDHSTIHRWVVTYSPPLEEAFHPDKLEQARILYLHSDKTAAEVCRMVGIGRRTLFSYLTQVKRRALTTSAHEPSSSTA